MILNIGFKGQFEDYQQNVITESPIDLSSYVFIDSNYNIHHQYYYDVNNNIQIDPYYKTENEYYTNHYDQLENHQTNSYSPDTLLYFKNFDPPVYQAWNDEQNDTFEHQWTPDDGIFLIPGNIYEYIISLIKINFITNEPPTPKLFDRYISYNTGVSNITNTNIIQDHIYMWAQTYWMDLGIDSSISSYISTYQYNEVGSGGGTFDINFVYPGKKEITNIDIKNKLSSSQFNDLISKCETLNYTKSVDFLNGIINGPFSNPTLYQNEPIIINYIDNDYRGTTDYQKDNNKTPDKMNDPKNAHLINFTKCSISTTSEIQFECLQHTEPINQYVQSFLKCFLDRRMYYYSNNNTNIYNQIKGD